MAIALQYVSSMDSGFMAKTGKLMPIKEPILRTLLSTKLIISICLDLFS